MMDLEIVFNFFLNCNLIYILTVIIKGGFLSAGYKSLEIYKLVELVEVGITIFLRKEPRREC